MARGDGIPKKVRDAYQKVRPAWLRRKGVLAVEIGAKASRRMVGGKKVGPELTGLEAMTRAQLRADTRPVLTPAIIVYVEAKHDEADLRANQVFPAYVDGVPVDVQVMPRAVPLQAGGINPQTTVNPPAGGLQIAPRRFPDGFGTLTFAVRSTAAGGSPDLQHLTCAHVAFDPRGQRQILQHANDQTAAGLLGVADRNGFVDVLPRMVDAATILADPGRVPAGHELIHEGRRVSISKAAEARFDETVFFSGAKTSGFVGRVSGLSAFRVFPYGPPVGNINWFDLIEIRGPGDSEAADGGDSGAAVFRLVNGSAEVLGMVLGNAAADDGTGLRTYAQRFLGPTGSFKALKVNL